MIKLKYLFQAVFFDGSIYYQNPEDMSVKFPQTEEEKRQNIGRSCMRDIQADVDAFKIKQFSLIEQSFFKNKWTVDLTDGHFEFNNTPFEVEGEKPLPVQGAKFKLIYYRVRRPWMTLAYRIGKPGDPVNVVGKKTGEAPIKYMIGWQCEIGGKSYIQKILVQ